MRVKLGTETGMDAQAWDRRYAGTKLVWDAGPNRFVVDETSRLAPGRALDLACGEGRNAIWLAARGWVVVGVDFSAVALEKARALAGEAGVDVEWVLADVVTWRPEPGAFDLVLLSYLHLPRETRRDVLAASVSALGVGGMIVMVGHDRANLTEGFGGPQDPSILLDADEVLDDLLAAARTADAAGSAVPELPAVPDLKIETAGRVMRPVPASASADGAEHTAIDTLVVAVRRC
jgi:SAM-dependent methyltransferase